MADGSLSSLSSQILLALADRARYGYEMIREIERQSAGAMVPKTGSLYTALQRLEDKGLIAEDPGANQPDEDDRRSYYRLTPEGRAALATETSRWERFVRIADQKRRAFPTLSPHPEKS